MDSRLEYASKMKKCSHCERPMTWSDQKRSFGVMIKRHGVSVAEAKRKSPICGKCVTAIWGKRGGAIVPLR